MKENEKRQPSRLSICYKMKHLIDYSKNKFLEELIDCINKVIKMDKKQLSLKLEEMYHIGDLDSMISISLV